MKTPNSECRCAADKLIEFWKIHRRFDANIRDLARDAGVSPDTVYRWLNRKAIPKPAKAQLIESWLNKSNP
ncbi:MAG: helix-turn-helix transcriptional regulator [Chlamydiota bacterium]